MEHFCLTAPPSQLGSATAALDVSLWNIARSVLVLLGIPLLAGYLTLALLTRLRGEE